MSDKFTVTFHAGEEPKDPNIWAEVAAFALTKAAEVADATGRGFGFHPVYGMGGYYTPNPRHLSREEAIELLKKGDDLSTEDREKIIRAIEQEAGAESYWDDSYSSYGWQSSSASC